MLLALTAAGFKALPFLLLWQAVTAFEQFGRAAEEAAVCKNLFQRGASLVQARVASSTAGQVATFQFVLRQQQLPAQGSLFEQQQGGRPIISFTFNSAGGRAFCAGRDVGAAPTDKDLELVQAVSRAIVTHPRPVIAAVHGWTVGAGFEWMMNADIVYAAVDARFKLPEASLGVFVTGGLVATLPSAIGPMRAKALMLLGETFDAAQALDWGLVYRSLPADELNVVSLAAARRIADLKPEVAREFKRVLNQIGLERFERAVEEETAVQRRLGQGDAEA